MSCECQITVKDVLSDFSLCVVVCRLAPAIEMFVTLFASMFKHDFCLIDFVSKMEMLLSACNINFHILCCIKIVHSDRCHVISRYYHQMDIILRVIILRFYNETNIILRSCTMTSIMSRHIKILPDDGYHVKILRQDRYIKNLQSGRYRVTSYQDPSIRHSQTKRYYINFL